MYHVKKLIQKIIFVAEENYNYMFRNDPISTLGSMKTLRR